MLLPISMNKNENKLGALDLKVSAQWRNLDVQHIQKHPRINYHGNVELVMIDRSGQRSYDVCVDRLDLVTGLVYTPGWLSPDGPMITLSPLLKQFLGKAPQRELLAKLKRAVCAYRALVQILDCYIPRIHQKHVLRLEKSRSHLWADLVELSLKDLMEKYLKDDFCHLLAYGTKKTDSRSGLSVFSGFLKRLVLTRAIRMNNSGESGRKAGSFIRSLYESKRCWDEMSSELKDASMKKHQDLLTSEKTISYIAKNWIKRSVNLVIPPGSKYSNVRHCVPTWSASFETPRSEGGNHSSILGEGREFDMFNDGSIRKFSDELEFRLLSESEHLSNDVKYQAIPEPGKYRVITVGREQIYSSLRSLQGFLISMWKSSPFGTMKEDVLGKILKLREEDGEYYFSGDYDSATDALSMEATRICLDQIFENLGISESLLAKIARFSFSGANIHYPDGKVLKQTRGQLMGHPLSFPLLCIINLSTFMRCYTITGPKDKRLKRVLINGDDILFKGKKLDGHRWRSAADDVGLIVNEMKTYESTRWALINSIFVDMTAGQKIEYVPLSVSLGHNVKRGEITRTLGQAPAIWNLIENSPNERSRQMCERVYLKTLNSLVPHLGDFVPNFFLHKDLGGIGLPARKGWRYGVSSLQRKAATFFVRNRAIRAIKEKITELPVAVSKALEKLSKLRPQSYDWIIHGKPVQGPLNKNQKIVSEYLDELLPRCLQSTSYITGAGKSTDYSLFHEYKKALQWKEPSMKMKKIKEYEPCLELFDIEELKIHKKNCTYVEIHDSLYPLPDVETE